MHTLQQPFWTVLILETADSAHKMLSQHITAVNVDGTHVTYRLQVLGCLEEAALKDA